MSRTAVIVQARMGSSRLPGKVMMDLCSKTVLSRVLERCWGIEGVDDVCCATVEGRAGDAVFKEAAACGVEVFRGSEQDVLNRYNQAAKVLDADVIVRICSDSPLIDPFVVGQVLELWKSRSIDYACNNTPPTWPYGMDCEVVSANWLDRADREARKPSEREHVTLYIRNHPDVTMANLDSPDPSLARYRWTVDEPADLAFVRAVYPLLPPPPVGWRYQEVVNILQERPDIAALNAAYERDEGLRRSLRRDIESGFSD